MYQYPEILPTAKIIGNNVINPAGEQLGNLKELVLDLEDGHIAYAVLSFGGVMGLGDKYFAIPWEAFTLDPSGKAFILDIDKELLKKAPGFDKDHWPDNAQYESGWLVDIYEYYGYSPYWMPDK